MCIRPNDRFGRLVILRRGEDYVYRGKHQARWECKCDCGRETLVRGCALVSGNTKSCGCQRLISNRSRPKKIEYEFSEGHVICTLANDVAFIIDHVDFDRVNKYGWSYNRNRDYVFCNSASLRNKPLSRFLLDCPAGLEVDHINHNRLDNRRCNLRIATKTENIANTRPSKACTSGYKGVSFCKQTKRWRASVTISGRNSTTIGRYDSAEKAAIERDKAVYQLHGEFAWLNFPERISEYERLLASA